jgi:hypothetical protein
MNGFGALLFLIFRRILFGHYDIRQKIGRAVDCLFVVLATSKNRHYRLFLARSTDIAATAHKTRMALESSKFNLRLQSRLDAENGVRFITAFVGMGDAVDSGMRDGIAKVPAALRALQ